MPYLLAIAGFFASIASFIIRHPFVSKMMLFTVFTSFITIFISYIKDIVSPFVVDNSLFSLVAYFGVFDGLSLYLTIILAGFGVKQILAFIRT